VKKSWMLIVFLMVVLAIYFVTSKQAKNAEFVAPMVQPIVVSSVLMKSEAVTLNLPTQVTVKAEVEQLLTARLTAQVIALPVREGDQVKAGDVLAQLDDKSSRADMSVADAQLAQYKLDQASIADQAQAAKLDVQAQKDTLSRLKKLALIKAASEDQIQQQAVRLAQAEQRLSAARGQLKAYDELLSARRKQADAAKGALGYVRLTALQAGTVAERLVQEGDIVTAGTPIIRLIGEGGERRLLVSLPADAPKPAGMMWKGQLLPVTAWPRANAQGLLTYEARVADVSLIPNQQLSLPLTIYAGEGFALPSQCFIPHSPTDAQVVLDQAGKAEVIRVVLDGVGQEGAVTQNARLQGQKVLCASSDVLIRIMAGRSYKVSE
jgi:multidrug efflux pump subunit AcrA (membrane-fusion protein)